MLLVIALIAAIGLITAAGLSRGFAGMQLRSAGKDIANQLRMVRAQAIARGEPQRFVIEPARRRWEGANQRHGEVPAQLQVQFEGAAQLATAPGQGVIEFHPDGGSSGGRIRLQRDGAEWRVDVGWLTGEVRSGPGGRNEARARGFTLLEVIIAFALLGLALTLLLGSLSGGAKQVREAELRTRAVLHAQSLLAEAGVDAPLQVGSQQGDWEQGRYHWELQVQPWVEPRAGNVVQATSPGTPWLAELQLQVRWGDSEREQLRWRSLRLLPPDLENAR
jgi:prepilin-type N-terminal cleavage/methylation domain-containing protein